MDRVLNMVIRRVIGLVTSRGIEAAASRMSGGGEDESTPEQRAQARQTAQRAKQALRAARRIGRF